MTVARCLFVDGALELQALCDVVGTQVKNLADCIGQDIVRMGAGMLRCHQHADRGRHAYAVGNLHFADLGKAGTHHVFGNIAGHVGSRSVNLGGVLS